MNVASPAWNVLRRPSRSAVEPDRTRRLASTSVYASTTHCSPDTEACSSRWIDGSATFTIVLSRPTMTRLMQQIARMSSRLRRLGSVTTPSGINDSLLAKIQLTLLGSNAWSTLPMPDGGLPVLAGSAAAWGA